MKTGKACSWLFAALAGMSLALPAQAGGVVDFEDVSPTLFFGTSIESEGFEFTSDAFGFSGVDNASAFSAFANAPANADGQFLFMLNADGMIMRPANGKLFGLSSFDASFIAPVGGLDQGIMPGELRVSALTMGGNLIFDSFLFSASDANGNFNFSTFGAGALAHQNLQAVYFVPCIYQLDNSCTSSPPAQFALDNINAQIPEPASLLLVILALGAAGATARRRRSS